jgi:hypothetical protein
VASISAILFAAGIAVQDGPYFAVRVYTLAKYKLLTYSIVLFSHQPCTLSSHRYSANSLQRGEEGRKGKEREKRRPENQERNGRGKRKKIRSLRNWLKV